MSLFGLASIGCSEAKEPSTRNEVWHFGTLVFHSGSSPLPDDPGNDDSQSIHKQMYGMKFTTYLIEASGWQEFKEVWPRSGGDPSPLNKREYVSGGKVAWNNFINGLGCSMNVQLGLMKEFNALEVDRHAALGLLGKFGWQVFQVEEADSNSSSDYFNWSQTFHLRRRVEKPRLVMGHPRISGSP